MKKFIILFISTALLFACQSKTIKTDQKPLVVCTTNIIADAAKNILKENATVISLMGPGVDPHLYKASQKDLTYLQQADVIIENGLHLEGKMANILEKLGQRKTVISMSNGLSETQLISVSKTVHDPHIWFDVNLWKSANQHLATQLSNALPQLKDAIATNGQVYFQALAELDTWVKTQAEILPANQRVLITAHDAFSYFGQAYGFEVKGLQGISTQSDYGLQDVSTLVNFINNRKIKALFVETSVSQKPLQAIVQGCANSGHIVNIGGTLYSDALGGENDPGNNYINMVKHNVSTIVNALK